MTVGEFELESVAADWRPTGYGDAGEVFAFLVSGNGISEQVALSLGFGAGRKSPEAIHFKKVVAIVCPFDSNFISNYLDIFNPGHMLEND